MTQAHTTPEDANSHPGGPGRPRGPSQSGLCTFAQPHPTGEEMEAQRSKATCLGSHNAPKRLAARTRLCQSHQRSPSLRGSGVMILEDALNPGNLQSQTSSWLPQWNWDQKHLFPKEEGFPAS